MARNRSFLTAIGVLGAVMFLGLPLTAGSVAAQASPTVTIQQTSNFGAILAGANGKTLYTLSADTPGVSTCTGNCATAWPPLMLASGNPVAPSGLTGTLGVITRSDGGRQVTFNNQPLYNFSRDANPGDTNGEGVNAFGGVWHVVRASGAAAPAAAAPAATTAAPAAAAPAAAPAAATAVRPSAPPATGSGGQIGRHGSAALLPLMLLATVLLGSGAFALYRARLR